MLLAKTVGHLREELSQLAFLEDFGNARPHLTGPDIDLAFQEAIRVIAPSQRVEAMEREMERLLGIVSDEEE
ncbi:hypothetical protein OKA05_24970 [Luteolibacter arcticus]|uniref:Uncharacterized protein n=1 Tax=Luteolibacter arcticus TaxID=1581411 RepID=A0ABT3GQS4_9BACT|nr:hypothetical protein [Luteolibacter arcticus]MCW1925835.1 hypothetical protein [Luteolibacter arcticus]